MGRLAVLFLVLSLAAGPFQALAASEKAEAFRKENGLVPFTASEAFLGGGFIASEMDPAFIYGPVKAFVADRKCATTWLIEEREKERVEKAGQAQPTEFTLYLEEDCPGQPLYYVFLDQSGFTPRQWLEWRRNFHKSKADSEYGAVTSKLEKALEHGVAARGELRFVIRDGEVIPSEPERLVGSQLEMKPVYDLNRQQSLSR